jgi:hypothetical protein
MAGSKDPAVFVFGGWSGSNHAAVARLFFRHGVPRLDQSVEFFLLLGNAPGCPFFILRARRRSSLLDQLPDIVPKHRDAVIEFG